MSCRVVDLTANARRFVGGDERSSFGAIACGWIGGGGGGNCSSSFVDCKINCCCVDPCVRTVYCVPPGDVHNVATCCCWLGSICSIVNGVFGSIPAWASNACNWAWSSANGETNVWDWACWIDIGWPS